PAKLVPVYNGSEKFVSFILQKGNEFEKIVIQNIKKIHAKDLVTIANHWTDCMNISKYNQTIEAMKKGVNIIYQGVLRNQTNNTYGMPDLMIRSDFINTFIPNTIDDIETKTPAPLLGTPYHYIIVDIKYSTLKLR